jgi:anti-sigma B factor antagonist
MDIERATPAPALIARGRSSSGRGRYIGSARPVQVPGLEPFAVDVQWRDDVATVQPRGELDVATVDTLRAALDGIKGAGRLVLDLRGLSFIDSTGLHLLITLHQHAQREGFQLTLVAPVAPADRAIQLSGLDQSLPFGPPVDAVEAEPGE